MRKNCLMIAALLLLIACGGKQTQTENVDAVVNDSVGLVDSTDVKAKEVIVGLMNDLYAAASQNAPDIDGRFACHAWRDTVAAVDIRN